MSQILNLYCILQGCENLHFFLVRFSRSFGTPGNPEKAPPPPQTPTFVPFPTGIYLPEYMYLILASSKLCAEKRLSWSHTFKKYFPFKSLYVTDLFQSKHSNKRVIPLACEISVGVSWIKIYGLFFGFPLCICLLFLRPRKLKQAKSISTGLRRPNSNTLVNRICNK